MFRLQKVTDLPPGHRVLKKDDVGFDVRYLQERLQKLGYRVEIDGHYGLLTEEAVRQFQKDFGLQCDGKVGKNTWEYLKEPFVKGNRILHIVKKGENINSLVDRYHINPLFIKTAKKYDNKFSMEPGQKIIIPVRKIYAWFDSIPEHAGRPDFFFNGAMVTLLNITAEDKELVFQETPVADKNMRAIKKFIPVCRIHESIYSLLPMNENNSMLIRRKIRNIAVNFGYNQAVITLPPVRMKKRKIFAAWLKQVFHYLRENKMQIWVACPVSLTLKKNDYPWDLIMAYAHKIIVDFSCMIIPEEGPLPFAPLNVIEAFLRWLLQKVPSALILLKFYAGGMEWRRKEESWEYLRHSWQENQHITLFDRKSIEIIPEYEMAYMLKYKKGKPAEFWFENKDTLAKKLHLLEKFNLPGLVIEDFYGLGKEGARILLQRFSPWEENLP